MLTLTIKDGESIYIGNDIQITVSEAGGRWKAQSTHRSASGSEDTA